MKKYEFTDETVEVRGELGVSTLRRIRALIDIPLHGVKAGDLGGFIADEHNLSHEGSCWVGDDAWVFGKALVYGSARVGDDAWVFDDALIYGDAEVFGNTRVCGAAKVYGNARVYDSASVFGKARVGGYAEVFDHARVCGCTWVFGRVGGTAVVGVPYRKERVPKRLVLLAVFGGPSVMLIAAMIAHIVETILS